MYLVDKRTDKILTETCPVGNHIVSISASRESGTVTALFKQGYEIALDYLEIEIFHKVKNGEEWLNEK